MAIRRPPTTFSDTISTADIADDAITGGKLANDIAISTTGNIATTGSGTLAVAGASTFTGDVTLPSKYVVCTKIFSFWHSSCIMGIVGNNSGVEVLSTSVGNATFANSLYFITCAVSYNVEDTSTTDKNDFAMGAWLQNADNSKNYRFGVYRGTSWTTRHGNMESTVGNYWLADTDGGHISVTSGSDEWNQTQFSVSDVPGKQQTSTSQGNVASNFSAGEALTLKIRLASHSAGINYNSSNDTQTDGRTANKSFYCIKEYTQVGS